MQTRCITEGGKYSRQDTETGPNNEYMEFHSYNKTDYMKWSDPDIQKIIQLIILNLSLYTCKKYNLKHNNLELKMCNNGCNRNMLAIFISILNILFLYI